jgi:disulfide bond formation protein DsbB
MPCPLSGPACALLKRSLTIPLAAKLLLVASLGSLIFALIMQLGFGVQPCILCLWQRTPYAVVALISFLVVVLRPSRRQTALMLFVCAFCFVVGLSLAIFHTGVELHWWLGTSGCSVQPLSGGSPEDLRLSLLQTVAPRCDQIAWTLFGLSMANYNIAFSLVLAFFATAAAAKATQD